MTMEIPPGLAAEIIVIIRQGVRASEEKYVNNQKRGRDFLRGWCEANEGEAREAWERGQRAKEIT